MIAFLQIISTSVSHKVITEPNNFLWDFSKDFLLPISLGALAAYMAYYIFIIETKREKDLEDARKLQERIDKLTFFSALVENGLQTSLTQTKNLKKQIRDITKDPIEFHLMTHVPLYDLKRITEVLNLEEYLLAYTNFYNEGRNVSTREFKKIIASCDYLYQVFTQIIDQLQKAQTFDFERKKNLQKIFKSSYDLLGSIIPILENSNQAVYNVTTQLLENFADNHPADTDRLQYYNDSFFLPFNNCFTEYLTKGGHPSPEILEFAILTRDGLQQFNHIILHNNSLRSDLTEDFKNIYKTTLQLKIDSKRLISNF